MDRPLFLKDVLADTNVVEWYYESKGVYAGTWDIEGSSRTVTLSDDNQAGRLAYVIHPAGATFFEYDALGRVKAEARYFGALPATLTDALTLSNMRVTETTYQLTSGLVTAVRYPSGRKVNYAYGTSDKRGPSKLTIANATNGTGTIVTVADLIDRDFDGAPVYWRWGGLTGTSHTITRDMLGRTTEIEDYAAGVARATRGFGYGIPKGNDGDPTVISDSSAAGYPQTLRPTTAATHYDDFYYDDPVFNDAMTGWTFDGISHTLELHPDGDGRRDIETAAGVEYLVTYSGGDERITNYNAPNGNFPFDINPNQNNLGDVISVDYGNDGTIELPSITYTARGTVGTVNVGTTQWTQKHDEQMRRWTRTAGLTAYSEAWVGGNLIERTRWYFLNGERDEYTYLDSMPIGVTHTDYVNTTPVTYLLSADQMGTPRRAFSRTSSLPQVTRLVMDAWGDGEQLDKELADPHLPFRYPGQLQDVESGLVENRWRTYLPAIGDYLSPDPAHQTSVSTYAGPQAYAYASGRPLLLVDPEGRYAEVCRDCNSISITMPTTVISDRPMVGAYANLSADVRSGVSAVWAGSVGTYTMSLTMPYGTKNTVKAVQAPVGYLRGCTGTLNENGPCPGFTGGSWNTAWFATGSAQLAAHEVGHMLGLPHDNESGNLMTDGAPSTQLKAWYVDVILRKAGLTNSKCGCGKVSP